MTGFFGSYLFAWIFWLSLSLGCLGLLLLHQLFRAAWGRAVLPVLEAGARSLPIMAVLFLPILIWGMGDLYPWVHGGDAIDAHRAPYLNMPFFLIRAAFYFIFWVGVSSYLIGLRRRERLTGDVSLAQRRTNVSAPSLVLFVLTVTFAMTDWVMSTEHHWFSTIYGVWFVTGQALSAVAIAALWWRKRQETAAPMQEADFPISQDLGNLLLAFTMMWAYISLSQFLIIWSANLPEETTFYLRRSGHGWDVAGALLIVGQFMIPFLALLSGKTKRSPVMLSRVAGWILAMRVLDIYWIVMPSVREGGVLPAATDVLTFAGIGIIWLVGFVRALRGALPDEADVATAAEAPSHA